MSPLMSRRLSDLQVMIKYVCAYTYPTSQLCQSRSPYPSTWWLSEMLLKTIEASPTRNELTPQSDTSRLKDEMRNLTTSTCKVSDV